MLIPFPAVGSENPPLTVIRKFVHLLDQSNLDFQEELEVARLREEVVTKIRGNQQLEKDLNLMDLKIGLLVKNRITLEVSAICGAAGSQKREGARAFAHNAFVQLNSFGIQDVWSSFLDHFSHGSQTCNILCPTPR